MKLKIANRIREIYNQIEEGEPDISTERLLCQTADQHNLCYGTEFDNSDVVDALITTGELKESPPAVSGECLPVAKG
jgi:hypothetical protein